MNFEQLDYRENDALQVSLLWNRGDDSLIVRVLDAKLDDTFDLHVQAYEAKDAFRHPFAYYSAEQTRQRLAETQPAPSE